ncbi:MAG: UDP-N-acetylmuramate dehydrogenase, partial [Candidatus Saccharimonadales bacterium]
MNIRENVSLADHSTMRLGGNARYLADASNDEDVQSLVRWAKQQGVPFMMIGQGSNIVWRDEGYPGFIIVNRVLGHEVLSEDDGSVTIRVRGGEKWDDIVAWTVEKGLSGIEFLSAIPGTVGAAPVQNIGAYGAELADTLIEVEAYDTQADSFGGIAAEACEFAYRNSRFKGNDRGQFMILGITLRLRKSNPQPPFYESLQNYFDEHKVTEFTPAAVREA